MRRTAYALLLKFLFTFGAAWIAFMRFGNSTLGWTFTFAIVATALNWFIGDRLILPHTGNAIAALADGVLGALTAVVFNELIINFSAPPRAIIIFGTVTAIAEYLFHRYLRGADIVRARPA